MTPTTNPADMTIPEQVARGIVDIPEGWTKFSKKLSLPCAEAQQLDEIVAAFQQQWKAGKKPYSLGVFGPPGSGKSTVVGELADKAGGTLLQFNLSQFADPGELIVAFRLICNPVLERSQRVVFFDEFDARLAGHPLGWLQWFLAPMEDGKFDDQGLPRDFGECVFIFGGGTAAKFGEFRSRHETYFHQAKGPDFLSRLSRHVDLPGTNGDERELRRAFLIRFCFEQLEQDNRTGGIPSELLQKLLQVGRYKYGSRSLKTVVHAINRTAWEAPPEPVLEHHVDGGPFDGIVVALSAGGPADVSRDVHIRIMKDLVRKRARIIYGYAPLTTPRENPLDGKPGTKQAADAKEWANNYTSGVGEALSERPKSFASENPWAILNLLVPGLEEPQEPAPGVRYEKLNTLSESDRKRLGIQQLRRPSDKEVPKKDFLKMQQGWSLSLFRMRVQLIREAHALIAMTGRKFGSSGRFPGVAEEVMLALAFNKPVYLIGGFGGAARAVGTVMGIPKEWSGLPPCLTESGHLEDAKKKKRAKEYVAFLQWLRDAREEFKLPYCPGLPGDFRELCSFLGERGLETSKWPKNGLSVAQNRELFSLGPEEKDKMVALIMTGLETFLGDRNP